MSIGIPILFFVAAFVGTALGVGLFTRWSLRRGFFDVPNERSSHSTPTPRGGGLIIVLVCLAGYVVIGSVLGMSVSWGYLLGALIVAVVSWIDDLHSLPFWSRLIFHIIAAGILMWDLGFWSELSLPVVTAVLPLGNIAGLLITTAWVVWLLNAYNFMDGIDGIAALQAVIASVGWAVLAYLYGLPSSFLFAGVMASASAGFLVHNWQPAKVFMGDVGSAFLGFTLAAMPLLARMEMPTATVASSLPIVAVLFVWFFVFDTVFTLVRRLIRRQRVWEAHREHIYQRLVIHGRSHATVTIMYGLAAAWLCIFLILERMFSGIFTSLAFLSLIILTTLAVHAGIREKH